MPDIKNLLNDEIRRLARKEIRIALEPVAAQISAQKKTISDLKKQIADLEKMLRKSVPEQIAAIEEEQAAEPKIRLNAAGIARIRIFRCIHRQLQNGAQIARRHGEQHHGCKKQCKQFLYGVVLPLFPILIIIVGQGEVRCICPLFQRDHADSIGDTAAL